MVFGFMVWGFADGHVALKMAGLVTLGYFTRLIAGEGPFRTSTTPENLFS